MTEMKLKVYIIHAGEKGGSLKMSNDYQKIAINGLLCWRKKRYM